jgi:hypothetical protein
MRYDSIYPAMGSRPRTGLAVALRAEVNKAGCLPSMRINRLYRAVCIRLETSSTN